MPLAAGEPVFSGVGFFEYTYDLTKNAANDAGFGLNRVYFTYQQNLSDNLSYKFQTDIGNLTVIDKVDVDNSGDDSVTTKKSQYVVYLKNANMAWKTELGKFVFGLQGLNMFSVQEKTWDYRDLEKSTMDLHGFTSSADMGIGYYNSLGQNIHYSFLYTNGGGYKKIESNEDKKFSGQVYFGESKLSGNDGYNAGVVFSIEPTDNETETVFGLFGGYAGNGIRFGAEFDQYTDESEVVAQIIAVYGNYRLSEKFQAFAYFDIYDNDVDDDSDAATYTIAGVKYQPEKGLEISPNIRFVSPDGGDTETFFKLNFTFTFNSSK